MKKSNLEKRVTDVCTNIQNMKEVRGLNREVLAANLGISLSTYDKIERGEIELTINCLFLIADIFETDIGNLLEFDVCKVFNFTNNQYVQTHGAKTETVTFQSNNYIEKYVKVLEQKISVLEKELE